VTLQGEDSEIQLGEGTNLLFRDGGNDKSFTIFAADTGFEIEIQIKKNSRIEAYNFTIDISGAEEAEAQFEENFCLILHGNLTIIMNTNSNEGGDVQFKKFVASDPNKCSDGSPNIDVTGLIMVTVGGEDSEIQIEEFNDIMAGGSITLTGNGLGSQVQTKKEVILQSLNGNITLEAPDTGGEVQAEENSIFEALSGNITLEVGTDGKLEVKKGSDFDAGGNITISPGAGSECKIEAVITGKWTGVIDTGSCELAPSI